MWLLLFVVVQSCCCAFLLLRSHLVLRVLHVLVVVLHVVVLLVFLFKCAYSGAACSCCPSSSSLRCSSSCSTSCSLPSCSSSSCASSSCIVLPLVVLLLCSDCLSVLPLLPAQRKKMNSREKKKNEMATMQGRKVGRQRRTQRPRTQLSRNLALVHAELTRTKQLSLTDRTHSSQQHQ